MNYSRDYLIRREKKDELSEIIFTRICQDFQWTIYAGTSIKLHSFNRSWWNIRFTVDFQGARVPYARAALHQRGCAAYMGIWCVTIFNGPPEKTRDGLWASTRRESMWEVHCDSNPTSGFFGTLLFPAIV